MTREDLPRQQYYRPFHKKTDFLGAFLEGGRIHIDLQLLPRLVGLPKNVLERLGSKRLHFAGGGIGAIAESHVFHPQLGRQGDECRDFVEILL